ncbi:HlyD family efflux transporter periplasmic adaptor subunit [Corallococcus carmarthensis]|uniref:HlyD family efflux transporter periplasmic adaptor subunit n=2 Tax=Corallococcus carmarthensis TaxID=2316728 RepID=A0A3A8JVV2_9BACT|nr:HlyD family efflux transporter periplasmic adaptor subunit [Corallococcus carmarthensis]
MHRQQDGDVLRLAPDWTRWTFWWLALILGVGLLMCVVGTVSEYAVGPALVRVEQRRDVTAQSAGVVATVEIQPGQRVAAGQVLVTLQSEEEDAELARIEHQMELLLLRYMRDLTDQGALQALTALRAEREQAQARLKARSLVAPLEGFVGDVRIHPGQYLAVGTLVASIVENDAPAYLLAILPGYYRPFLRPGMPLRVELEGFQYEYRELVIESVGEQLIGPGELKRYLSPDLADTMEDPKGPVVLVRAPIPSRSFSIRGRRFEYFEGMPARAQVAVRSEAIFVAMIPGLKVLFPNDD